MTEKYSKEFIINEAGVERDRKRVERFWSIVFVVLFLMMIWTALIWETPYTDKIDGPDSSFECPNVRC
ncbi:MAG: hypothetical protein A3A29_00775 [Candidatus Ryanbacteria bacterium RIFCSPLOWO2_01_FULL_47_79]|uniref:Uncharacterized protein n=2 Tax=Parcubacteria group TaxID=1794811 RepID=A0A0G1L248_9BACT|nr:MAG: hypothetical protein UW55_C0010G0011 [Candidatus Giovannonibacteria bacterium GW2011_GWA2_44_26]OGN32158.1 MAG: hypothetical protein A3I32_00385 [Candidatus Yanofskybacteria bacterium RIFCSPLOWO2_02_FULL_45_10]OGZ52282.1 MAG: hypothetical protein A3A29_00775 [Candidatus Ryanbacteria bacterium RIFCSPLOWO2_01_FULL_47_79]